MAFTPGSQTKPSTRRQTILIPRGGGRSFRTETITLPSGREQVIETGRGRAERVRAAFAADRAVIVKRQAAAAAVVAKKAADLRAALIKSDKLIADARAKAAAQKRALTARDIIIATQGLPGREARKRQRELAEATDPEEKKRAISVRRIDAPPSRRLQIFVRGERILEGRVTEKKVSKVSKPKELRARGAIDILRAPGRRRQFFEVGPQVQQILDVSPQAAGVELGLDEIGGVPVSVTPIGAVLERKRQVRKQERREQLFGGLGLEPTVTRAESRRLSREFGGEVISFEQQQLGSVVPGEEVSIPVAPSFGFESFLDVPRGFGEFFGGLGFEAFEFGKKEAQVTLGKLPLSASLFPKLERGAEKVLTAPVRFFTKPKKPSKFVPTPVRREPPLDVILRGEDPRTKVGFEILGGTTIPTDFFVETEPSITARKVRRGAVAVSTGISDVLAGITPFSFGGAVLGEAALTAATFGIVPVARRVKAGVKLVGRLRAKTTGELFLAPKPAPTKPLFFQLQFEEGTLAERGAVTALGGKGEQRLFGTAQAVLTEAPKPASKVLIVRGPGGVLTVVTREGITESLVFRGFKGDTQLLSVGAFAEPQLATNLLTLGKGSQAIARRVGVDIQAAREGLSVAEQRGLAIGVEKPPKIPAGIEVAERELLFGSGAGPQITEEISVLLGSRFQRVGAVPETTRLRFFIGELPEITPTPRVPKVRVRPRRPTVAAREEAERFDLEFGGTTGLLTREDFSRVFRGTRDFFRTPKPEVPTGPIKGRRPVFFDIQRDISVVPTEFRGGVGEVAQAQLVQTGKIFQAPLARKPSPKIPIKPEDVFARKRGVKFIRELEITEEPALKRTIEQTSGQELPFPFEAAEIQRRRELRKLTKVRGKKEPQRRGTLEVILERQRTRQVREPFFTEPIQVTFPTTPVFGARGFGVIAGTLEQIQLGLGLALQKPVVKTRLGLGLRTGIVSVLDVGVVPKEITAPRSITRTVTDLFQEVTPVVGVRGKVRAAIKAEAIQRPVTRSIARSITESRSFLQGLSVTRTVPGLGRSVVRPTTVIPLPRFPGAGGLVGRRGFDVFVREKGSKGFFKASRKALPRNAALNFGGELVDNSSAATFKIVPSKKSTMRLDDFGFNLVDKFRKPRKGSKLTGKNVFIERRERRIDTGGELRQITAKGLLAQRRKRVQRNVFGALGL